MKKIFILLVVAVVIALGYCYFVKTNVLDVPTEVSPVVDSAVVSIDTVHLGVDTVK